MTEFIDPELRDDRDETAEGVLPEVELPEYDPEQFELDDDFEFEDEDDEEEAEDA